MPFGPLQQSISALRLVVAAAIAAWSLVAWAVDTPDRASLNSRLAAL